MLPNSRIDIDKEGGSTIVGLEKSDSCHKLSEMGSRAGKVTKENSKDHPPVTQHVSRKG